MLVQVNQVRTGYVRFRFCPVVSGYISLGQFNPV